MKGTTVTILQRAAQGLMAVFGLLIIAILASVYADTSETRFPDSANALIATAGVAFGTLVIALATAGVNSGERWAWLSLWVLPGFFLSHCLILGTWIPDGLFLVLSVVALTVTRPRYGTPQLSRGVSARG